MNLKDLVCQFEGCKLILEHPVTLPCGYSLCKKHLDHFNHQFDCLFCNKKHQMPDYGLSINTTINQFIQNYFEMDPLRKQIKDSFNNLNKLIHEYEKLNPQSYINDYIEVIINKVDIHREELIQEIHKKSNEIIKQLKMREEELKLNAFKVEKVSLKQEISQDLACFNHSLRKIDSKQQELNDLLVKMNEKIAEIQTKTKNYKNDLTMNQVIYFDNYDGKNLFGNISFYSSKSSLILSKDCGKLMQSFQRNQSGIYSIQVDESSKKLITGSHDKIITIWDIETGERLKTLQDRTETILTIPNNRLICGLSDEETIQVFDLNSYKCLNTLELESRVDCFCLISENEIACGCRNGSILILNLDYLTKIKAFKAHEWIPYLSLLDKTKLITCSGVEGEIRIWDLETCECIKVISHQSIETILYLEFTLDGNLFSFSWDQTVNIWELKSGNLLKSIHFEYVVNFVQTLNDELIAVAFENGEIQIYNYRKEEIVKTISAHGSNVSRLYLLKNGHLLSGSTNGDIKLWKLLEKS